MYLVYTESDKSIAWILIFPQNMRKSFSICKEINLWRIAQLEYGYKMVEKTCPHWVCNKNNRRGSDCMSSVPFCVNFHYFFIEMWLYPGDDTLNVGFELKNCFWFILIKLRLLKTPEKRIAWLWWLIDIRNYWDNLLQYTVSAISESTPTII